MIIVVHAIACASADSSATQSFEPRTIARHLETPWSLDFAPDGRLFVAERPGRIRVIAGDSLATTPWATITVEESASLGNEGGLMGLAIDPEFAANKRVYVCFTARTGGNSIAVLTEVDGRGADLTVLVADIPAGRYHNGCRLKFGLDGKLYATTGDADNRELPQSPESLAGKVLRLNTDGSVPADNPFPGSFVWSLGHRNSQGLAFHPESGTLFATEHGTGEGGNNELNVIERGRNYGWPIVIGQVDDARFVRPVHVGADAPAGATFITGNRYPELHGNLLVVTLFTRRLLRVVLATDAPVRVSSTEVLIEETFGRLRDVIQGPDGYIYLATSNRDGRGQPDREDDRIIRLMPR